MTAKTHGDTSGPFPITSPKGNRHFRATHIVDANAIVVIPMKDLKNTAMQAAWTTLKERLVKRQLVEHLGEHGYKPVPRTAGFCGSTRLGNCHSRSQWTILASSVKTKRTLTIHPMFLRRRPLACSTSASSHLTSARIVLDARASPRLCCCRYEFFLPHRPLVLARAQDHHRMGRICCSAAATILPAIELPVLNGIHPHRDRRAGFSHASHRRRHAREQSTTAAPNFADHECATARVPRPLPPG